VIGKGDYVTVGNGTLTWEVVNDPGWYFRGPDKEDGIWAVLIRSGQSGREQIEPLRNLTLYQKGNLPKN